MASDLLTMGIPFVFTLAIVYGALETGSVFKNQKVNGLISVAIAFFVLAYQPAITFINEVLPYAIGLFVVVFFLGFVKKMFAGGEGKTDYTLLGLSMGLLLLFLAYQNAGGRLGFGFSDEFVTTAAVILVGVLLYTAYKKRFGDGDKEK